MKRFLILWALIISTLQIAHASRFTVNDIRVDGLRRITTGTFFSYLPVKIGDTIDDDDFAHIIRTVYQTSFFESIELRREQSILRVSVVERPIIQEVVITGNKEIDKDTLNSGLKDMGLAEGDAYDPMRLNEAETALLELYYTRSKYDVILSMQSIALSEGQVKLLIDVKEGISARIAQINLVGNAAFSEGELLDLFTQSTSKWHSLLSKGDQYAAEKLRADIKVLEDFYFDHGFLDFYVESTQVSLTSDKKSVYITINLREGLPYQVTDYQFIGNDLYSDAHLLQTFKLEKSRYYNRSQIQETVTGIKNLYAEKGYALTDVQVIPNTNKENQQTQLTFSIAKGKKVYVRRIRFAGNFQTNDEVLRRELRQMESGVYDHRRLQRSEERLRRLSHITNVVKKEIPVPGKDNQVDVIYEVTENPTRSFSFGVGYGSETGVMFNAGYSTGNLFGSGYKFNLDFSTSDSEKNYSINFTDPYWNADGVSLAYHFFYNETDESDNDIADWASDNYGAMATFGIPISEYRSVFIGGGYRNTTINPGTDAPQEILDELAEDGSNSFDEFLLNFSWTHDTRDRTIFAKRGFITRLSVDSSVPGSDETYYKLNFRTRGYFPVADEFILSGRADLSYGDGYGDTDGLPFYRRFYAGGLTTVRGFQHNSLGPRFANGQIAGGDFRATGGVELIFPWHLGTKDENVRLAAFSDFGNVYANFDDFDSSELRYSAGVYLLWQSPIGPLNFSYAVPLNEKEGDEVENFQFTIGVPF